MNNRSAGAHTVGRWLLYTLAGLMLAACGDDQLQLQPDNSTPPVTPPSPAFSFSIPVAGAEIDVNTASSVSITWVDGTGAPKVGETVYFTASRGALSAPSATTNASGKATVTVTSSSAGQAAIRANNASNTLSATQSVLFVSKTAASISVQAESTALVTSGTTTITATVRDSSGNPVKGKVVGFTLISDLSGGPGLSEPTATTDASGKAVVTYTAGPLTTATNGVEIKASVQGSPAITTNSPATGPAPLHARLTVGGQALFIAITSGNTVSSHDATRYALPYGVHVTDSSGNPVPNKTVSLSVIPTEYYKGQYVAGVGGWVAAHSSTCANEDLNLDGILDSGEDLNGNAMLDPGNPVSVSVSSITTDSNGIASFSLIYGKNYANWLKVRLKTTTSVTGSESVASQDFLIPALAADVNSLTIAPPGGGDSPFGTAAVCTSYH